MDLSPGTRTRPRSGRPPVMRSAVTRALSRPRAEPPVGQGRPHAVGRLLADHHHQHALGALDRVGDLQVLDVDVQLAEQGGDLGQHARPVGHRHPDLGQLLGLGQLAGQADPGHPRPLEGVEQAVPVAGGDQVPHVGQRRHQAVEGLDDGGAVLGADVGPDPGGAGGDAGHVPEPPGGQPQEGGVLGGAVGGEGHQGGGGEVGHVGHHGHHLVVAVGLEGDHVGPHGRHERADAGERGRVGVDAGREDPRRPFEQPGVGAVDPVLLGAGHGVPAHEPGIADRGDDRPLHAADVGDHAGSAGQGGPGLGGDGQDRRAHEGDVGCRVVPDGVQRPQLEGPRRPVAVEVAAGDVPSPGPQGQADRAADQPGPHDAARRPSDGLLRTQTGRSSFSPTAPSR